MAQQVPTFLDVFADLENPRIDRKKLHPVPEILLLTLCEIIAGCEGWEDIEDYCHIKLDFLRNYLPYENGVPSDDTLRRFFRAVDPKSFQSKFLQWVKTLDLEIENRVVAIDGKTLRRSHDGDKSALHIVSAFACEARIVLGQKKVSDKSNEITAIPELLEWLDVKGAIVTIDAMGCQREIAANLHRKEADYVLALKGNQATIHDDVRLFLEDDGKRPADQRQSLFAETVEKGHGRIEIRRCYVTDAIDWLPNKAAWAGLRTIVMIHSIREIDGKQSEKRRFYLSSLPPRSWQVARCDSIPLGDRKQPTLGFRHDIWGGPEPDTQRKRAGKHGYSQETDF